MKKTLLFIAPVVMLALAACNKSEAPNDGEAGADGANTATSEPIEMPPSIVAGDVYRCGDGTILHVDFLGNEGTDGPKLAADIRVGDQTAPATRVDAPKAEAPVEGEAADTADTEAEKPAGPMVSADGETTLSGEGASINVKLSGKGAQTCKG
ncbi:MAG: hypothetical protein V3V15_09960 [Sphingorhabdus sp.]